ncbi:GTP pyrophosphokinase [Cronobacter sakazakii SP291]|uniref:RelA/SpoT domain-containing protein n=2 Tax=Enterobacterales TaxID=91347 RepID=UPI0002B29E74|nr:RelA/SpoT domain-containing protein [Cronobacter sakazakii]AGE85053.1 GTP pyrophosphokinase [Cronobacter sakazakii SP291]
MANDVYQSQKCTLRFSKKAIDRSAQAIRHGCVNEERQAAIEMIQNFRELHLYPLMLMKNHLARTSAKVNKKIIVARRLKRLPTIIDKLERPTLDGIHENSIKLTRMQDIGGCRAIVKNLEHLKLLQDRLEKSRSIHTIVHTANYLTPKASGYGGVHLIYSCFHEGDDHNAWKKTKIEVQLRTELQHAWATSLEIIDTLEGYKLKTSQEGHEDWRRLFYLAGCLVAHDEGACILSDETLKSHRTELSDLHHELQLISKLARYSLALHFTNNDKSGLKTPKHFKGHFLIEIGKFSKNKFPIRARAFKMSLSGQALEALAESEANEEIVISVLLSAENVKSLKKAYPNYFGSTELFSKFLQKHIDAVQE